MDLVRGLMDTDGASGGGSRKGIACFANKNERLIDDFYRLAAGLALRPSKQMINGSYKGEPYISYRVGFQQYNDRNPFYLSRKANNAKPPSLHREYRGIRSIEPITIPKSSCILVEGELYVVGRQFVPTHNTTIVTEGGCAWELLRQPSLAIRISNAIADFAHGFKLSVKAIFDSNDLVKWLYGQKDLDGESWVPENEENWNRSCMIMPNRGRYRREHSIESGGATGAAESHHFDLHVADDLIGMAALDGMRRTSALMQHTKNWFWANEDTLLTTPRRGRIIVVGTRYAVDDLYSEIISKAHVVYGTKLRGFPYDEERSPEGYKWQIYYRKCIEDGKVIFPEEFSLQDYDRMAKEKWWEYVTQYLNDPQEAGLAELNAYKPRSFQMEQRGNQGEWYIVYERRDYVLDEVEKVALALSDLDVVMAIDPAATEKYISAKTSKSAIGLLAQDWEGNKYLFALKADYISPSKLFDETFQMASRFGQYVRNTYLESNAGFKVLGPLFRDEERRRGIYLGLQPFPAIGDKDARIRSNLQPELDAGRLFVHEVFMPEVVEELGAFPQSHKKDIIDMLSSAVANSRQPLAPEEIERRRGLRDQWSRRPKNAVGY